MQDLTGYNSILIFGGSFDPPHVAHTLLPRWVAHELDIEAVAFIPAGRAPHKLDRDQTDPQHRLAMLRLALADESDAVAGLPEAVVLTDEIDRTPGEPSYTVDTLARLHERIGEGVSLRLLFGGDQLRIFDQWREPDRVVALAEPVVMVRPPETSASLLGALPDDAARATWEPRLIEVPRIDLSSTDIRERIAQGKDTEGLVAPAVAAYIQEHGLYRTGPQGGGGGGARAPATHKHPPPPGGGGAPPPPP
ncbi:MAG: nicotinate (nicotinamide) nucleotide adenylyltransferase, partial [Planctomycetota bacterium]